MNTRDRVLHHATRLLARTLLPVAFLRSPRDARRTAAQWALAARFPHEDLTGLDATTRARFTEARTDALWGDGVLIGLTSGHRDAEEQQRLFLAEVRRLGSEAEARRWVLPPEESSHVLGTALDVRPVEGARWLERHGARYGLFRVYDNEWWHFEHLPEPGDRPRLPHPAMRRSA
ncbi:M15 family metallopeptidase [Saccharothrix obliqua]|uniref:M15 family metallopeptidase n=1 Tax=Saccharothrix obliqua TaxID=2861747 RepID=UPI001C5D9017|nr:M15 family metallopeptidase [Saccharothrix obliqua]MBW4716435.1 M15 family metallopeptidase [Saccharothrix obliqua]